MLDEKLFDKTFWSQIIVILSNLHQGFRNSSSTIKPVLVFNKRYAYRDPRTSSSQTEVSLRFFSSYQAGIPPMMVNKYSLQRNL